MKEDVIGFIYRIDYMGDCDVIKGTSYGGSKKITQTHRWEKYFGSPSKLNCERCEAWKRESFQNPHLFNKQIISYVYANESIAEKEAEYLRIVSDDIVNDPKWLNTAIPRKGAFPEFKFTSEQMAERERKRQQTVLEKTGTKNGILDDVEKRKQFTYAKYGVEHYNQLPQAREHASKHRKEYFGSLTADERKAHGQKSLANRAPENVERGRQAGMLTKKMFSEEKKRDIENRRRAKWEKAVSSMSFEKKQSVSDRCKFASNFLRPLRYITIEFKDSHKEADYFKEWYTKIKNINTLVEKYNKSNEGFVAVNVNGVDAYVRVVKIEKIKKITFNGEPTHRIMPLNLA